MYGFKATCFGSMKLHHKANTTLKKLFYNLMDCSRAKTCCIKTIWYT